MIKRLLKGCLVLLIAIYVLGLGLFLISKRPESSGERPLAGQPTGVQAAQTPASKGQPTNPTNVPGPLDRRVFTYYFYWYETKDGKAGPNGELFAIHPPAQPEMDYHNVAWHKKQLMDMRDAGIDVVLPVYWGTQPTWSTEGLVAMVKAADQMVAEGQQPPKIGLFLDTTILDGRNLLTQGGKDFIYREIKEFYKLVPERHRATVNGRPIIWLFKSDFASGFDQTTFDYLYSKLAADFGGKRPFIVREVSWDLAVRPGPDGKRQVDSTQHIVTDASYFWGSAFMGALDIGTVASVGPGYDDRRIPDRPGTLRDRAGGAWYEQNLVRALKSGRNWLVVETWNELFEGTGICETTEYGRRYIELTRKYADYLKQAVTPPPLPAGKYAAAQQVSINLGQQDETAGLKLVQVADGLNEPVRKGDRWARQTVAKGDSGVRYLYFDVDDDFIFNQSSKVTLVVDYFDEGKAHLGVQYDSWGPNTSNLTDAIYKYAPMVDTNNSLAWRTATVTIPDARFGNRQNSGADFRLRIEGSDLAVARVIVRK